jgi:hypothetical protein
MRKKMKIIHCPLLLKILFWKCRGTAAEEEGSWKSTFWYRKVG